MNRDDIIRMAREAGIYMGGHPMNPLNVYLGDLERFAGIVAAAERERIKESNAPVIKTINEHIKALEEARKAEREACAKVCDQVGDRDRDSHAYDAAAAIRARGQS
jgi:uncharacterized protein YicC (UPF0701 family)